jgi:nitrilase
MPQPVELVAIQLVSEPDVAVNLAAVETQLQQWAGQRESEIPALVVLPECFAYFGGRDRDALSLLAPEQQQALLKWCCDTARDFGVWLVTGSLPTPSAEPDKMYATCLLIDPTGQIIGQYHKGHLFDVQVADNTSTYSESATTTAGDDSVTIDSELGRIGLAICYDLRFSGLFQAMSAKNPLDVIVLPAAFTYTTGKAHWHTLLAARAIEYQCYVVAADQGGTHANGRETFGHSVIYSPWGEQLTSLAQGPGWISAITDPKALSKIRNAIPMAQHRRTF